MDLVDGVQEATVKTVQRWPTAYHTWETVEVRQNFLLAVADLCGDLALFVKRVCLY